MRLFQSDIDGARGVSAVTFSTSDECRFRFARPSDVDIFMRCEMADEARRGRYS
jgi:hypothetical protein